MASTYTAAGIELIAQGEQAGAWGATTNTNWELVEEMIGGVVDITLTGSTYSLVTTDATSSEGRHSVLNFSGSPGATCTVTVTPNDMQKVYFVVNGSDETVTISQGSGANVSVSAGKNKIVFCDGAGAGAAVTDISSGFDATTLAELGVTATATELNYVDGVTSSIQTQLDAMVEKAGDTMTGALTLSGAPTADLHAATKVYVDNLVTAGISYHDPVRGEVETNLSATYNNGSSGVGATLTATSNGAFTAGGISDWSTTERVLVYNQTTASQNGIYTVTTVGDGSNPYVLTRATDADSYGGNGTALSYGTTVFVQEGDGAGELYVCNTEGTITFGTTNITFAQIATAAIYSAGSGLDLNGTEFSHTDTSSQASVNNSGNTFIQDVTVDGFGHVTGLTSAAVSINNGTLTMATSGTGLSGSATFTANSATSPTFTVTSNATSANTGSTIVARDASGNFTAGTITAALSGNVTGNVTGSSGSCTGNAATATKWATGRTISLTGDVTGTSGTFDGSGNLSFATTIAANSVALGTDTTGSYVQQGATSGNGISGSVNSEGGTFTVTSNATNANTANTIVYRDASGNFSAGTITATLSGNASTATSAGTCTGNAATATALATARSIGLGGDVSGSASFDGSANITITATVADDSHNHTIANVDGLQTALDGKLATGTDKRGSIYYIGRDTNDYIGVETTQINFVLDGNTDMRLYNNGDLHADGNVIAYSTSISDERLKEDIVGIDDALNKVCSLSGYTFKYKADGKVSAGVIAQEVEKVLPEAVTETELLKIDDGNEYKVVNYDALHGLLIEAIKELKAEVAELKAKVG